MTDKEKYFQFLSNLRETGITNMYGAGPYLEREFELTRNEAREVVLQWMKEYRPVSSLSNSTQSY